MRQCPGSVLSGISILADHFHRRISRHTVGNQISKQHLHAIGYRHLLVNNVRALINKAQDSAYDHSRFECGMRHLSPSGDTQKRVISVQIFFFLVSVTCDNEPRIVPLTFDAEQFSFGHVRHGCVNSLNLNRSLYDSRINRGVIL